MPGAPWEGCGGRVPLLKFSSTGTRRTRVEGCQTVFKNALYFKIQIKIWKQHKLQTACREVKGGIFVIDFPVPHIGDIKRCS